MTGQHPSSAVGGEGEKENRSSGGRVPASPDGLTETQHSAGLGADGLLSFLRELSAWLSDPKMSTWSYMEGSAFYADKAAWLARINRLTGDAP